jgi:hypothetical protein
MNIGSKFRMAVLLFAFLFTARFPAMAEAAADANIIASRVAEVEGIKLHYLIAGHGPAVPVLNFL